LRARNYSSANGRFTQEDPARSGDNWYVYTANNPILFVDPSGLAPQSYLSELMGGGGPFGGGPFDHPWQGAYDPDTGYGYFDGKWRDYKFNVFAWMFDYYGYKEKFDYDWKIGEHVTYEFLIKMVDMCEELQIDPDDMLMVMASESGIDPTSEPGPHTIGIIQFTDGKTGSITEINRIHNLGLSIEKLRSMSAVEQLDYVYLHYAKYAGKMNDIGDIFMVNAAPSLVGNATDDTMINLGNGIRMSRRDFISYKREWLDTNLKYFLN
jgi:hypothetical protein